MTDPRQYTATWIPVTERLPDTPMPRKTHDGWWVYRPGSAGVTMWETTHPSWWAQDGANSACPITHWLDWQPPAPPEIVAAP